MILPEDVYEMQKNYIEMVKKPFTMSVRDFVKRIRKMASFLPEFPMPVGASGLSQIDLKNIIFRGMPSAWQENFILDAIERLEAEVVVEESRLVE
eukprot:scaffold122945_cov22-Attheya_sp.AAC.1